MKRFFLNMPRSDMICRWTRILLVYKQKRSGNADQQRQDQQRDYNSRDLALMDRNYPPYCFYNNHRLS
jgi:hypothetical protein